MRAESVAHRPSAPYPCTLGGYFHCKATMHRCGSAGVVVALALCLVPGLFSCTSMHTQPSSLSSIPVEPKNSMTRRASGAFEVKLSPQAADDSSPGSAVGRMLLDKQFHGDLEATSKGQMLAARSAVDGSAGYVAMEQVRGTLHGRSGTFVLQHSGIMTRGAPQLVITIVPDSGTDQLAGISGTMTINIANGKHSYEFDYTLPQAR